MEPEIYIAQFADSSSEFYTMAFKWQAPNGPILPDAWWKILRANPDVDVAMRFTAKKQPTILLLLTAGQKETLQSVAADTVASRKIAGLERPSSVSSFDALTNLSMLPEHLRTCYEGYHRDGLALACDFRLYSAWFGHGLTEGAGYQITLRTHPTVPEQKRRVLKYLAWLELEQPFTEAVRELQGILCNRLLENTWLADEYLLFSSKEHREVWQNRIRTHFAETTGRIGFPEAPIEAGDFSDWLLTGCHTLRDSEIELSLPEEGALAFSEDEVVWIGRQCLAAPPTVAADVRPKIFFSYASADFAQADATRQYLENKGWRCWIAPRDINRTGLPYTEAIPQAMQQVSAIVVLLSQSANVSVHIPREVDLALERKLPIIPLRLVDILPAGQLEYLLRTCQWLDMFQQSHDSAMKELERRLSSLGI